MAAGGESLRFSLTVTDASGDQDTDTCIVVVSVDNLPPTADAGVDQTVNEGDTVTLDGSNSSDSDGTIAAYLWEQTGRQSGFPVGFDHSAADIHLTECRTAGRISDL